jgi:hypothetical protein
MGRLGFQTRQMIVLPISQFSSTDLIDLLPLFRSPENTKFYFLIGPLSAVSTIRVVLEPC